MAIPRKPVDVSPRERCEEENAFYQPKKIFLFSLIAFVAAFVISRTFSALQRSGYILSSPNVLFGFHLHHWAYSIVALSILLPLAFYYREKKNAFGFIIIIIAFFVGLFIDGIVYDDSIIFWE